MLRSAARARTRPRVTCFVFLVAAIAAGCGATPSAAPSGGPTPSPAAASSPASSGPAATPAGSSSPAVTPRPTVATTPKSFWSAAARGLVATKHLQVTIAGPNPGVLRFQPSASATIVGGRVVFVCVNGAAFDGQSAFARVPGTWACGVSALVSSFRQIGQPADSWNETSPTDSAITEAVTVAADGTWTWAYAATSGFYGGRVTVTVRLDPNSGRILAARRVDPTGVTAYTFDYDVRFPALAVPPG